MNVSFAIFRERGTARLFTGQLVSQVCDKMMAVGLVWVIVSHASLQLVPWFLAAGALPHLLLARFTGPWIAAWGPLRSVVAADLARGAVFLAAAAAWALWPAAIAAGLEMPLLFAATVLANVASAVFNPAIMSLPPQLPLTKPDLLGQLTAMVDSCFSLGNILGPLAAALLYPVIGMAGLFLANAVSYLLAAALEAGIAVVPAPPPADGDAPAPVLTLDRLVRFMLGTFFVMNLALTPLIAFLPLFARAQLGGGIGALAGMETSIGLGTVLGSVALTLFKPAGGIGHRAIAAFTTVALMYLLFSSTHNTIVADAALFVLGLALSVANVALLTVFQTRPAPAAVPRVMSLVNLISVGAVPFSMAAVGALVDRVPLPALAQCFAATLLVVSLATVLNREFRQL